jgi:integrase
LPAEAGLAWLCIVEQTHQMTNPARLLGVSKRDAESYEKKLWTALSNGTYRRKEDIKEIPTLRAFKEEFMTSYVRAHNKPSEQQNKEMHLKVHLLPFFGDMKLNEIRPRDIDRYTSLKLLKTLKRKKGLSPKTINLHLSTLRRALVLAREWELIAVIPPIRRLKEEKPEFFFLDFGEAERLIEAADPEWRTMIVVALKTGMRLGELLALRWIDVDLVAGRVMVRRNYVRGHVGSPKSGKAREIPLCDEAIAALKMHRHLKGGLVFCNKKGDYLTKEMAKCPLPRAARKAGLAREQFGWHALRHTFASHLAMKGAPAKAIQELLGHSTIEMTNRYMHLSPDARREAVKLLDSSGTRVNGVSTRVTKECN